MEIVGLKNFVPDDVNNLIFKFLGIPKKKTAEELNTIINLAMTRGARAIDPKNPNRFFSGREPEYYIQPLLNYWFGKPRAKKQKQPERATDYIRKMFNKELNKNTTEEKLIMLKAKFERQPVNIQREILAMPLSFKKVKTYLYKGVVPETIKEEMWKYSAFRGYWGGFLT